MRFRPAFLLSACGCAAFLGCSTKFPTVPGTAAVAFAKPVVSDQAELDRDETAAHAEYTASQAALKEHHSASAAAKVEATQAAYHRAVERAMEYCRPRAELASRYFNESPRAIYINARAACRALGEKGIKSEVVAVIDGGTRFLKRAGADDRGHPPGRDRSFGSYLTRYKTYRREGLSHEEAIAKFDESKAL